MDQVRPGAPHELAQISGHWCNSCADSSAACSTEGGHNNHLGLVRQNWGLLQTAVCLPGHSIVKDPSEALDDAFRDPTTRFSLDTPELHEMHDAVRDAEMGLQQPQGGMPGEDLCERSSKALIKASANREHAATAECRVVACKSTIHKE